MYAEKRPKESQEDSLKIWAINKLRWRLRALDKLVHCAILTDRPKKTLLGLLTEPTNSIKCQMFFYSPQTIYILSQVDEWLEFSDARHMSICKPALGAAVSRLGMNWRKHYGSVANKTKYFMCDSNSLLSVLTVEDNSKTAFIDPKVMTAWRPLRYLLKDLLKTSWRPLGQTLAFI